MVKLKHRVPSSTAELRKLFDTFEIEQKVATGKIKQELYWAPESKLGSRIVRYILPNGWILGLAHQRRDALLRWAKPDPNAFWIDDVRLS